MTSLRALGLGILLATSACVPGESNCDVLPGATFSTAAGEELSRSECDSLCRSEVMGAYPSDTEIVSCELEEAGEGEDVYFCEWEAPECG